MMASHNNFDNQTPAMFDRHPQSPSSTASSTPNYLTTTPSVLAFAQPPVSATIQSPVDGHQTPPPIPPHQNPSLRISQPSADSSLLVIDGQPQPVEAVQNLIISLRREIALRDDRIAYMTTEIEGLRRVVGERNRDVDQLRSVLDQKYIPISMNNQTIAKNIGSGYLQGGCEPIMEAEDGYMTQISRMTPPPPSFVPQRIKKQGVSGESVSRSGNIGFIHYEKDQK
uniref:CCDC92 domain-containing protein n=1 Tax=Mesocestoides corti TaxID=53468 RepID=A0A5K3F240_MESCO